MFDLKDIFDQFARIQSEQGFEAGQQFMTGVAAGARLLADSLEAPDAEGREP